jgi:hypothetical protein
LWILDDPHDCFLIYCKHVGVRNGWPKKMKDQAERSRGNEGQGITKKIYVILG